MSRRKRTLNRHLPRLLPEVQTLMLTPPTPSSETLQPKTSEKSASGTQRDPPPMEGLDGRVKVSTPAVTISVQQADASMDDVARNPSHRHHVVASVRSSTSPCTGGCCCTGMSNCGMGSCCYFSLTPSAINLNFFSTGDPVPHQLDRSAALLMILGLDRPPKA